jgi:glycine betaine/proline transport system permease protein
MNGQLDRNTLTWLALLAFLLVCLAMRNSASWLITFPDAWQYDLPKDLNAFMNWFVDTFGKGFRKISAVLEYPIKGVQAVLRWLPWAVVIAIFAVVAHAASGWRLAAFTFCALLYMVVVGYWSESMNSLSLVAISVPFAVTVGFIFGICGFFSARAERVIMPCLDLLQTVPAFAYLLPILLLFGFGTVVGLIASVLFAFPPMVRNTILGLRRVPAEVIESGLMSGATGWQLFWLVQVPTASRQILLGVNQTTMAALSMVIIASIIGGTADIGWEVLSTMRKAQFGESVLAGIVIALIAMVMDRITVGLATKDRAEVADDVPFVERYRYWLIGAGAAVVLFLAAQVIPFLKDYPDAWRFYPASWMNEVLEDAIVKYRVFIETIKTLSFFYVMLPTRIGLEQTVSPYSWGFELTVAHQIGYVVLVAAAMLGGWRRWGANAAVFIAFTAITYYFGLTKLPWPALVALATFLAWRLGGVTLAVGTFLSLSFLLAVGVWPQAMLSVYLCGIGVVISFVLGCGIGILASEFDRVSAVIRPINDTLQTMPLFVILIPFVMIFKIGEFTALLAIVAYAVVPAIRYSEHGLRNLPKDVLEAAESMGCTRWQMLWQVKLPLALPVIMLGLNQTILYGISMLVIAAVVGTNGLGQQVYIGLGDGDFGVGIIAGVGMAIIAMIADRMTQAWSRSRQEAFGLA